MKNTAMLLFLVPAFLSCDTKQKIIEQLPQDDAGNQGDVGGVPLDADTAFKDTPGTGDPGPETATEPGPDTKSSKKCDPLVDPMNKRIGHPCTSHGECETCYCYDEDYLAPFRFCTKDCSSGAGSGCAEEGHDVNEYKCLKFTASQVNDHDLTVGGICMPSCGKTEDCKLYGDQYNYCPGSWTKWEGSTVGAATCQTSNQE